MNNRERNIHEIQRIERFIKTGTVIDFAAMNDYQIEQVLQVCRSIKSRKVRYLRRLIDNVDVSKIP